MPYELPFTGRAFPEKAVHFEVDDTDVRQEIQALEGQMPQVMERIQLRSTNLARQVLVNVFADAVERLDYEQFAPEFRDKLFENLSKMPIATSVAGRRGEVEFDLDFLGTREDLEKAFHQGAVLKNRHKLPLGTAYEGQELAIGDADVRHEFFEAMLYGEDFQARDGRVIKTAGLWEATKQAYLKIWGDKSPQWLYLQFGQSRFEPKIPAYGIIETVQEDLGALVELVFEQEIEAALAIARDAVKTPTKTGRTVLQAPGGGLTIRGKFYPGGRFVGPNANF